jgi:predicted transcriptional regulator
MLAGTLGGYTRGSIIRKLSNKPYDTNQIGEALNLDHITTIHHLHVLAKNGMITTEGNRCTKIYFLSKDMIANLNEFNIIWEKLNS